MKKMEAKPFWRVAREQRLRGRRRIQYNWGWKALLRFSRGSASDPANDGWRN